MDRDCPVCKSKLILDSSSSFKGSFNDYYCSMNDHHFSERISNGERTIMKVRVSPSKRRMYFKVTYTSQTTEIWEGVDGQRVRVDYVFEPDFSNLELLANKLRTYLVFS